ncbi:Transcriptional repressor CTCFL [Papilio machaon]|uniref:Transcriptional repressor CTCFL n=1 Tax=Papilio machaon TaxID=76193 RepID=A0A0N1IQE9_PAPMA|nr:Transcriptional repressor CTCFL [Papilio machaon]
MSDIHDGPIFIDVGDDEPAEICVDFADNSDQLNSESKRKESKSDFRKYNDVFLNVQSRRFRCPECNRYTAETEEKIQRHIKKVHRGENPFQCCMCEYSTYNSSVFEEHLRVHQGGKQASGYLNLLFSAVKQLHSQTFSRGGNTQKEDIPLSYASPA